MCHVRNEPIHTQAKRIILEIVEFFDMDIHTYYMEHTRSGWMVGSLGHHFCRSRLLEAALSEGIAKEAQQL